MRRLAPTFSALVILLAALPVAASLQAPVVFTSLEIDLWPGYDRPGVLVIYRGSLAPDVELPARLSLQIPAAVGAPSAVAELRADGQLMTLPYDRTVDGEVATIETIVTRPQVQVEYYDPRLEREGAEHRYQFEWPGDYEVAALTVAVQVPDLATDMVTIPEATSRAPSIDGLTYHSIAFPALQAGEPASVSLAYTKASDQLTVETMMPAEQAPPPPATTSASGDDDLRMVLLIMGGVMVGAIVITAFLVLRRRSQDPAPGPRGGNAAAGGKAFCTQCGAAASGGDKFCHQCGNSLR